MSARAMMNCGLSELRLVNPRDGWPNSNAIAASAEADKVIRNTRVYQNTSEAIADLEVVFAASARVRDMTKPIINPEQAVEEFFLLSESSTRIGVMFGCESKGLKNDDVTLADALINIPLNPHFNSPGSQWTGITSSAPRGRKRTRSEFFLRVDKKMHRCGGNSTRWARFWYLFYSIRPFLQFCAF